MICTLCKCMYNICITFTVIFIQRLKQFDIFSGCRSGQTSYVGQVRNLDQSQIELKESASLWIMTSQDTQEADVISHPFVQTCIKRAFFTRFTPVSTNVYKTPVSYTFKTCIKRPFYTRFEKRVENARFVHVLHPFVQTCKKRPFYSRSKHV